MRLIVGDELKRDLQKIITNYNENNVQETCYDVFAKDINFRDNLLICDTIVDVPANYILQICPAMSFQRKFIGKCFVPVTIPHAVIAVATADLENPCPERLSKPDCQTK